MVVVLALGSAFACAVAMVLQQRSAQRIDPAASLRPGLVVQLLAQPWWLVGIAANVIAFGLRTLALAHGSLVLVQPLVLTGLFFALVLDTQLGGRRITSREAGASVALVGGLSLFALAASPSTGTTVATTPAWLVVGLVVGALSTGALAQAGRATSPDRRAAWLAGAGGLLLAALAALTKQATAALGDEGIDVLGGWVPYAVLAVGGLSLVVTQSAFQAAPLRASLPVLSVVEPLASIVIGAWAFHEQFTLCAPATFAQIVGLIALLSGVVTLTSASPPPPLSPTPSLSGTADDSTDRRVTA